MKKKLIQLLIISALFLQFINLKAQPYVIDNEEIDGLKNKNKQKQTDRKSVV
jgi:hypothetical protein